MEEQEQIAGDLRLEANELLEEAIAANEDSDHMASIDPVAEEQANEILMNVEAAHEEIEENLAVQAMHEAAAGAISDSDGNARMDVHQALADARAAITAVAQEAVGQIDSPEIRNHIADQVTEIEHEVRRALLSNHRDVYSSNWSGIPSVSEGRPSPSNSTTETVANVNSTRIRNNSELGHFISVANGNLDGSDTISWTSYDQATVSAWHHNDRVDYDKYFEKDENVNVSSITEVLEMTEYMVKKYGIEMSSRPHQSEFTAAGVKESQRTLTKLDEIRTKIRGLEGNSTEPTMDVKRTWLKKIAESSSLFFSIYRAFKLSIGEDHEFTPEEEDEIGRVLKKYLRRYVDSDLKKDNIYKEITNDIIMRIRDRIYHVEGEEPSIKNLRNSFLEGDRLVIRISTLSQEDGRCPLNQEGFWNFCQETSTKLSMSDREFLFNCLQKRCKYDHVILSEGISSHLRIAIIDMFEDIFQDRASILDNSAIVELIKNSEIRVELSNSYDTNSPGIGLEIRVDIRDYAYARLLKRLDTRSKLFAFFKREMISPYETFHKENCYRIYNGLKSRMFAVDSPEKELYASLKALDPVHSLGEPRRTMEYYKTIEEDYPFAIHIRSGAVHTAQLLMAIVGTDETTDKDLDETPIGIVNNDSNNYGGYSLFVPIELVIKLMGYSLFRRFVNERRRAEVSALMAVAIYENKKKKDKEEEYIDERLYWDRNRSLVGADLCYCAERATIVKDRLKLAPKDEKIPWASDPIPWIQPKSRHEWDMRPMCCNMEEFKKNLWCWAADGYRKAFCHNDSDRKFLKVHFENINDVLLSPGIAGGKFNLFKRVARSASRDLLDNVKAIVEHKTGTNLYLLVKAYEDVVKAIKDNHLCMYGLVKPLERIIADTRDVIKHNENIENARNLAMRTHEAIFTDEQQGAEVGGDLDNVAGGANATFTSEVDTLALAT